MVDTCPVLREVAIDRIRRRGDSTASHRHVERTTRGSTHCGVHHAHTAALTIGNILLKVAVVGGVAFDEQTAPPQAVFKHVCIRKAHAVQGTDLNKGAWEATGDGVQTSD